MLFITTLSKTNTMTLFRRGLLVACLAIGSLVAISSCSKDYSDDTEIPKVLEPTLYSGNNNNYVYAIDPLTGAKKWEFNAKSPVVANVVIHNNAAWVGTTGGMLYKLDRITGKVISERNMGAPIVVAPLTRNNILYVASGSKLHSIDNGTLATIFEANAGTAISGAPTMNRIEGKEHEYVFLSNIGGQVKTFRADSLFDGWTFTSPLPGAFNSAVCVENESVAYIGNQNGFLYAINTRDGSMKWSYRTDGGIASSPITIGGNILFGSNDTYFYSIDTETGRLRWRIKTGDRITGSAYVYNQNVYFGSYDKEFYCVDIIDGVVTWKIPTPAIIKSSPVVYQNRIYFTGYDNVLYCLDPEDGGQYWTKNIYGQSDGSVMIDGISSVSVAATDGNHILK